jgi:phage terminase large subunit-like protein
MKKYEKQLNKYIKDIQSNKIAAGELLKLSIERYKKDLKGKYELNSEVFERCCAFLSTFKHYVGSSRGKNF